MRALKGHGTENDFVLVPDLDGALTLTADQVRALCDRHAGIGGDGVLRVVRTAAEPEAAALAGEAEFFMDYRNADGSIAEMCGNGVRVFYRYLQRAGLVDGPAAVATRGGVVQVRPADDGEITVAMGVPRLLDAQPVVAVGDLDEFDSLAAVTMPNPHVVVQVSPDEMAELDLTVAPVVDPPLPDGQNVEFVLPLVARRIRMRVFERGVGETRSCGTGICAAVVAVATSRGLGADREPWTVDVPGGTCRVVWRPDGIELTGPAVIVAEVDVADELLGLTGVPA